MLYALASSLAALLYEFSVAQFVAMALGNSALGYTLVVGVFLAAMGIGAAFAGRVERPRVILVRIQLGFAALALLSLPLLVYSTSALRNLGLTWMTRGAENCHALTCSGTGLSLLALASVLLGLVGIGVGLEVPLYARVFDRVGISRILAGDYFGAFLAGILFAPVLLPRFGIWGVLAGAALIQAGVAFLLAERVRTRALAALLAGIAGVGMFFPERIEGALLEQLVVRYDGVPVRVQFAARTSKQQILVTEDGDGSRPPDRRLYLDGVLQSSSAGNEDAYHRAMVAPARAELASVGVESARVLILGGGEGTLARYVRGRGPRDSIQVVDFDETLLKLAREVPALRQFGGEIWEDPNVSWVAADAFWWVRAEGPKVQKFDLVLIDFPHSIGDASALKVETQEFFRDLAPLLSPVGRVVAHTEHLGSPDKRCAQGAMEAAGLQVRAFATDGTGRAGAEAMMIGVQDRARAPMFSPHQPHQLRPICRDSAPSKWWGLGLKLGA